MRLVRHPVHLKQFELAVVMLSVVVKKQFGTESHSMHSEGFHMQNHQPDNVVSKYVFFILLCFYYIVSDSNENSMNFVVEMCAGNFV